MSVQLSVNRLRELAELLPRAGCEWEGKPTFSPPPASQTIKDYEQIAGFEFPVDFQSFLEITDSVTGATIHNGYFLGGISGLALNAQRGDLPTAVGEERAIPIATDGGGNSFMLSETGCIWRWNHESGNVAKVATSFGEFLKRVADDWAAYVSDTPNWRYLV